MKKNKKIILSFFFLIIILPFVFQKLSGNESLSKIGLFDLGPGDYEFSLRYDGLTRRYLVHVPPSYNSNVLTPAVLNFHGGSATADWAKAWLNMDETSDNNGFIVVYPEGTGRKILGRFMALWNAEDCCGAAMRNNVDDIGFVSSMIDKLGSDFNIDKNRVYATGISNGAQISYRLACELSDKIAAIAPIAAVGEFSKCNPKRPVPIIHFHGRNDPCTLYAGGTCGGCLGKNIANRTGIKVKTQKWTCESVPEHIKKWVEINELSDAEAVTVQEGNLKCVTYGPKEQGEVTLCTVEGMGHVWPGAGAYGPACKKGPKSEACIKRATGEFNYDVLANEMMWEFFKKHPITN